MQFFSALLLLMRFIIGTDRLRSALLALLAIAEGLLGPAVIAASGVVVSRAPAALGAGTSSPAATRLMVAIGVLGACFVLAHLLAPVREAVATSIGSQVNQRMRELIFAATLTPAGIAHLEDSATADEIRRGGDVEWEQLAPTTRIVREMSKALTTVLTGVGAALLLGRFAWWAPVVLVAACLATHLWMAGDEHRETAQRAEFAVAERRADYFRDLALDPPAAKETRLFGLAGFLAGQARRERLGFLTEVWRARRANRAAVLATISAIAAGSGAVFGALGYAAANGRVSAAELTVAVQAVFAISGLGHPLLATWWVRQGAAALPHLVGLAGRTDTARTRLGGTAAADGLPRHAIRFAEVRFRYPGADRWVLDGVDLEIPAGTSLALVGANGEGKTTLLSLLARFHDPDGGAIVVDGRDLRELEPRSWRRQLAVIFQDFVRYERSARENISLNLTDPEGLTEVERAAERAGARGFVADLPAGWETVLSRQYRGGADLSGGQWQRIALARALHAADRGARVLVLDEPAAALDVRAEAELFDRFLDLTAGITTILVTHRLSSVRHADRIAVLEGGRIVEVGTHEELVEAGGAYARMFGLQAARFHSGVGRD